MNQQSRITRTHIQGVVNNVFDVAEKYGIIPEPEDFLAGIRVWMEEGMLIRTLPGIDNKRLPVPEINMTVNEYDSFETGDYVLATKWGDGDPQDAWCIGFFQEYKRDWDRSIVVDEQGKPFRANGYRKCKKISQERGKWMLDNVTMIEQSDLPIWDHWFRYDYEKEIK